MSVMRGPEEDETGTGAGADPHLSDVEIEAERGVLVRPSCGNSYLHHGTVTVFDRREDAPRVRVTEVSAEMVLARVRATKGSGNPSTRRDGLTIAFDYECCPTRLKLELA